MAKSIKEGIELTEKCLASGDVSSVDMPERLYYLWGLIELSEYRKVQLQLEKVDKRSLESIESLSLYLITFGIFVAKSGKWQFARDNFNDLKKAVARVGSLDTDNNLSSEQIILCAHALYSFSVIAKKIKKEYDSRLANNLAEEFKEKIRNNFWTGDYFCRSDKDRKFNLSANVLAVVFELTYPAQNRSIYEYMSANKMFMNPGTSVAELLLPLMLWRLGHKLQAKESLAKLAFTIKVSDSPNETCQLNCSLFIYIASRLNYSM